MISFKSKESGGLVWPALEKAKVIFLESLKFSWNFLVRKCFQYKYINQRRGYWAEIFTPRAYDKYIKLQKGDSG